MMGRFVLAATLAASIAGVNAVSAGNQTQYQNEATQLFLANLNTHLGLNYLWALLGLTLLTLVINYVFRLSRHLRHLASLSQNPGAQKYFATPSRMTCWLKDHLLYAPLLHHRRATELRFSKYITLGTIPTRSQAIFVSLCIIYNIFACVYHVPWGSSDLEVLPILRNRTGTLSVVNLIPLVIMATIKNPLINLLDISYDSFNLMHRWIGRLCIMQGVVHTVCYIVAKVRKTGWGSMEQAMHSPFIYTGAIGTIGFVVILLQSPKLMRSLSYEFFLHSHIVLVVMAFIGLWYHLSSFPHQQMMLLAAIIIWGGSRAWRFATTIYRSVGRGGCKAVIDVLPDEAMRVEFTTPRPWTFRPGQTLYLSIPSVGWWTNHPFSVAWSDYVREDGEKIGQMMLQRSASTRTVLDEKRKLPGSAPDAADLSTELRGKQTFSLIVKKRDGFTAKLFRKAQAMDGRPLVLNALIEGPYGHAKSMASYGTVVLFASGVGITHQMPYIRELVDGYAEGTVATQRITLVWVVPNTESLEWVRPWMHEILGMDRRRECLKVLLYISKATLSKDIRSPSATVRMSRGRPNVLGILREECQEGVGCVAVSCCAGGGLGDEVRRSTRLMIGAGYNADLVEEFFGW